MRHCCRKSEGHAQISGEETTVEDSHDIEAETLSEAQEDDQQADTETVEDLAQVEDIESTKVDNHTEDSEVPQTVNGSISTEENFLPPELDSETTTADIDSQETAAKETNDNLISKTETEEVTGDREAKISRDNIDESVPASDLENVEGIEDSAAEVKEKQEVKEDNLDDLKDNVSTDVEAFTPEVKEGHSNELEENSSEDMETLHPAVAEVEVALADHKLLKSLSKDQIEILENFSADISTPRPEVHTVEESEAKEQLESDFNEQSERLADIKQDNHTDNFISSEEELSVPEIAIPGSDLHEDVKSGTDMHARDLPNQVLNLWMQYLWILPFFGSSRILMRSFAHITLSTCTPHCLYESSHR